MRITRLNSRELLISYKKKIVISFSKKRDKIYRAYQLYMNEEHIRLLLDNEPVNYPMKVSLNLLEINDREYQIVTSNDSDICTADAKVTLKKNEKWVRLTLPKNDMPYLKAYDTYLKILDKLNNKSNMQFSQGELTVTLSIKFSVIDGTIRVGCYLSDLRACIDDSFKEYFMKREERNIPLWFEVLTQD